VQNIAVILVMLLILYELKPFKPAEDSEAWTRFDALTA
jgi:hypothetical protein